MNPIDQLRHAMNVLAENERKAWYFAPTTTHLEDPNAHLKHDSGNHLVADDDGIEVEVEGGKQAFHAPGPGAPVSRNDFIKMLKDSEYGHFYTDEGMNALYGYYIKADEGVETNVDEIAIDWEEFSEEEFVKQLGDNSHTTLEKIIEYMGTITTVISLPNGRWLVKAW